MELSDENSLYIYIYIYIYIALFYFHYVNIIIYFSYNLLGERLDNPCFFCHPGYCQSDIIII